VKEEKLSTQVCNIQINIHIWRRTCTKHIGGAKIIHHNYKFKEILDNTKIVLMKDSIDFYLELRKIVRIISKEDNIPLLACISESGSISEVDCNKLVIDLRQEVAAERVKMQLFHNDDDNNNNKLVIISDEINLTRRMLNPLHSCNRLASDIMISDLVLHTDGTDDKVKRS
jgi:hypothetical protein